MNLKVGDKVERLNGQLLEMGDIAALVHNVIAISLRTANYGIIWITVDNFESFGWHRS